MRIAVIGASGAGLPFAAFLMKKHPDWEVHLFDANSKLGKKLLATGNGHCNLLNVSACPVDYNSPSFVSSFFQRFPYAVLEQSLLGLGVPLMKIGNLVYPKSFTSSGYVDALASYLTKKGVHAHLSNKVFDYKNSENYWVLRTFGGDFAFDKLVFCTGGKSGRNLGSDGNLFDVYRSHGYRVSDPKPGLCPVKTLESTKSLNGLRHMVKASILKDGAEVYCEEGEVLFKQDGLSGIAIFNLQRRLAHHEGDTIALDLFPKQSEESLASEIEALQKDNDDFAPAFLAPGLFSYCLRAAKVVDVCDKRSRDAFSHALKHLVFHVSGFYDFPDSQVTLGGISLEQVSSKNCESRIESNVYFLGEVLDVDGPCGGYNLEWCLLSALALVETL